MAILTQNIKLLKSAVMTDTSDGGGQMTGTEVIDGQSNNLFPDTSAMDRAFGRVNMRKVFGVAHTSDTDTLLGAHAIMTDAPDDPLVHCTLLKTSNWSDERDVAREAIEKYLVKGPKAGPRIYDTHYAGSLQLRLITFVGATFPAGGDAIVLTNPDGTEQYVRILKISMTDQSIAMIEGTATVVHMATIGTCDLGSALSLDILGPPGVRVLGANGIAAESTFATAYTTNIAGGAKFYGVKPLGVPGAQGDLSVTTAGGIYTNLVPAATIETPIIDQYPYLSRQSVVPSGYSSVTLPAVTMTVTANTVITAPTPITPTTVSLLVGATVFTDNGAGVLTQGVSVVGKVSYVQGKITLASNAPNYGASATILTYKPGTITPMAVRSSSFAITLANQGLAFTNVFEPPPAQGTFTLDFMAQGRWYTLRDNGNGKLEGDDAGYGVGTLNYNTGSMSVTLGAIPDVGSVLLATWGNAGSAASVPIDTLPTKLTTSLNLTGAVSPNSVVINWSNGATNYTATSAGGELSGDATGQVYRATILFSPSVLPSGSVTVTANRVTTPIASNNSVANGGGVWTLPNAPVNEGSVVCTLTVTLPSNAVYGDTTQYLSVRDRGGILYATAPAYGGIIDVAVGTIDYTTGIVNIGTAASWQMWLLTWVPAGPSTWNNQGYWSKQLGNGVVALTGFYNFTYSSGVTAVTTTVDTLSDLTWSAWVPSTGATTMVDSAVFSMSGDIYSVAGGTIRKGWNVSTGVSSVASAGAATSNGQLLLTSLPSNRSNVITWYSMAQSLTQVDKIWSGVFRTSTAPLKTGVFQIQSDAQVGTANDAGNISGGGFSGTVDAARGLVVWNRGSQNSTVPSGTLSYNAVYLQYLPLDASLLGLETARLPLDGKVPIYRTGDLVVVHNTLSTALANPLVKDFAYTLGRERIASVRVKDALGVVVPDTLYTTNLNGGFLTVPAASVITSYSQPLTVEHRIEDMLLCSKADISGTLSFTRSLTHNFPANTSFVSSAMPFGDLFARVYGMVEQATWTNVWQDTRIGSTIIPQFNSALYPIAVTNAGSIKERWALIFTNITAFRIIGESVGEIGSGNTSANAAPLNPATGVPYFTVPAAGWGAGWAIGNVLRFNTDACGTPFWAVRTVLQGPTSINSDQFTLAFRGDVDRP